MLAVQTLLTVAAEPYSSPEAQALVVAMAEDLAALYGPGAYPPSTEEEWTAPRGCFVLARLDGTPAGCGGWRRFDEETVEIKRVFVVPAARGRGVARALLSHLEADARDQGHCRAVLETGVRQEAALRLYRGLGWSPTACWPPCAGDPSSVCLAKPLC